MWITGYTETGNPTADGTPTTGQTWGLAAAHPSVPFDTIAAVDGLGVFRVADRGALGPNDLDVLVESSTQAHAITGSYRTCLQ